MCRFISRLFAIFSFNRSSRFLLDRRACFLDLITVLLCLSFYSSLIILLLDCCLFCSFSQIIFLCPSRVLRTSCRLARPSRLQLVVGIIYSLTHGTLQNLLLLFNSRSNGRLNFLFKSFESSY